MSLSNIPLPPREKNPASTIQEPRDSLEDSFFLRSKETEKKSPTSMSQKTLKPFVCFSDNTDEEVLKRYESYLDNPNDYEGDNILINNTTNMLSPSGALLEGNIGSQQDPNPTQMKPTSRDVKNNSNQSYLIVEGSNVISDGPEMMPSISIDGIDLPAFFADSTEEDPQLPYDNLEDLGILGEGSGIDTTCLFKNKSNIAFGSFGSIESMMNAKREREKIVMIPTPTVNDAPQMIPAPTVNDAPETIPAPTVNDAPQWTIRRKLIKNDINPYNNSLILQESSVDEHIRRHMPVA
ncbi:PREDICTED: B3 domain-containing protein At4g02870-like [Camelina sativa]|uniref:B3 domain-containing protein At4g02870-like n=1 Tax=Camelina sativa TaxID=90675 RepID=A0ABM0SKU3_CAMSA|nr:PREDICTED: B3 domain-containing protein At4g02870-like [Camelina sativa]